MTENNNRFCLGLDNKSQIIIEHIRRIKHVLIHHYNRIFTKHHTILNNEYMYTKKRADAIHVTHRTNKLNHINNKLITSVVQTIKWAIDRFLSKLCLLHILLTITTAWLLFYLYTYASSSWLLLLSLSNSSIWWSGIINEGAAIVLPGIIL